MPPELSSKNIWYNLDLQLLWGSSMFCLRNEQSSLFSSSPSSQILSYITQRNLLIFSVFFMKISLGRFKVCPPCIIGGLHYLMRQCCQTFQHYEGPLFLQSPGSFLTVPRALLNGLPETLPSQQHSLPRLCTATQANVTCLDISYSGTLPPSTQLFYGYLLLYHKPPLNLVL